MKIVEVPIKDLNNGNNQQRGFLEQLDEGKSPFHTDYYRRLKDYRRRTGSRQEVWSNEKLHEYMLERVALYEDVKENGIKHPLRVRRADNRIVDGNHRAEIWRHLGHDKIKVYYVDWEVK